MSDKLCIAKLSIEIRRYLPRLHWVTTLHKPERHPKKGRFWIESDRTQLLEDTFMDSKSLVFIPAFSDFAYCGSINPLLIFSLCAGKMQVPKVISSLFSHPVTMRKRSKVFETHYSRTEVRGDITLNLWIMKRVYSRVVSLKVTVIFEWNACSSDLTRKSESRWVL